MLKQMVKSANLQWKNIKINHVSEQDFAIDFFLHFDKKKTPKSIPR